jgi:hypothetical protein
MLSADPSAHSIINVLAAAEIVLLLLTELPVDDQGERMIPLIVPELPIGAQGAVGAFLPKAVTGTQ